MYYVTMIDNFMSGWGMAEGKINRLVLECCDYVEAMRVESYAKSRSETSSVSILSKKPSFPKDKYFAQYKTIEDMPRWYGGEV